jgi:hypothetical protein
MQIRCLFDLWIRDPGMGKKSKSGSGMNIPGHISESLEAIFGLKMLKLMRIRNPFYPGTGIRDGKIQIRDKHPGSATLLSTAHSYLYSMYANLPLERVPLRFTVTTFFSVGTCLRREGGAGCWGWFDRQSFLAPPPWLFSPVGPPPRRPPYDNKNVRTSFFYFSSTVNILIGF